MRYPRPNYSLHHRADETRIHTSLVLTILLGASIVILAVWDGPSPGTGRLLSFSTEVANFRIYTTFIATASLLVLSFLWFDHFIMDTTSYLLLLRVPLLLIPLFYTDRLDGYLGNYTAVVLAPAVYMAARSLNVDAGKILRIISVVAVLVISLQVIANAAAIVSDRGVAGYTKYHITIPIGKSDHVSQCSCCL